MKSLLLAALCTIALGAAAPSVANDDAEPKLAGNAPAAKAAPAAPAPEAAARPSEDVPKVAIESFANVPVCRRHVPTGSRIAVERCTSRPSVVAAQRQKDFTRQQIETMREQQIYEEQARQALRAEMMRRRFDR